METTFVYDRFVSGKDFLGRNSEVQTITDALRDGGNVALFEPAKTGVNSVIRQTLSEMKMSGDEFVTVECSLLGVRTLGSFSGRISDALSGVFTSTPAELESFGKKYLGASLPIESIERFRILMEAPYIISQDKGIKLIFIFREFQDILAIPDGDRRLKQIETCVAGHTNGLWPSKCSFIWCGSQVNSMKFIFEERKFFFRCVTNVHLPIVEYKEVENYVTKRFLANGKVIETEIIEDIYKMFRGNLWYINHFCAICDALSRGYVTVPVVQESINSLISIHEPRFIAAMHDLTTFQTLLLKAIVDGETRFSSERVIELYGLNSSANVRRLKDALCKKEIITFEDSDRAVIMDPLFEYWLRTVYFA